MADDTSNDTQAYRQAPEPTPTSQAIVRVPPRRDEPATWRGTEQHDDDSTADEQS
jgi:hypothetical protein